MTTQLTDSDIQEILDRNNLEISFNEKTGKHELYRLAGIAKRKLSTSQFKTPLIASARTIDRNRFKPEPAWSCELSSRPLWVKGTIWE